MKTRHLTIPFLLLLLSVFLIGGMQNQAAAAPARQGTNLLSNSGFEQPYVNGVAENWSPWHIETEKTSEGCESGYHYRPKWNMETGGSNVADGVASQYIGNNWDTWSGGVFQTVDVTPGVTYRFTFSAKGRTTSEPSPAPSDTSINMNIRAGIDPNGSGLWNDGDVVWGTSGSPHDAWQQFSVEATAAGDKMTVFTSANLGVPNVNQCLQFLDTWFDSAELVAASPPPSNTPPPAPPAAPAPVDTPTPLPSPTVVAAATTEPAQPTVEPTADQESSPEQEATSGGTICVNAFHDVNANGVHDAGEGYMADVTFTVANQTTIVGSAISEGSESPKCFYNLETGSYQVAQQVPAQLQMTSDANTAVGTTAETTVNVGFGSRVRGAPVTDVLPDDSAAIAEPEESGTEEVGAAPSESGGTICVNAFHDENANGIIDPSEGYMAGVTLFVADEEVVVGQAVSEGSDAPQCFGGLESGSYEVSQQVSDRLEMTTAENAMVALSDGKSLQVEFGSRLQQEDTGSPSEEGSNESEGANAQSGEGAEDGGLAPMGLIGLAVIVAGVILLGVLIFFLLRR
ncbi:MAG: hypothetical protein GWP61_01560 [Chloroflexi bacterium]|nr:hypothetical protein [Chloroflexota bacterium]